jgi:hypothetical protein
MEPGGGGSDGAGDLGVGGLVGSDVGGIKIGLALGLARLEDVGRERRAAKSLQIELFRERTHNQLAAGDGFFNTEKGGGRRGSVEGVWKEVGARHKAFGGSSQGGPPARAGFLKKQQLGPILGTDEAGRDHPGVIEYQEVVFLEQVREVFKVIVLKGLRISMKEQKPSGVARVGWLGGDLIRW